MNKRLKSILKIVATIIVLFFIVLLILPYAFRSKITQLAKQEINAMLNAKVEFDNVNLSFIRSFPNASVKLENFKIVGLEDFKNDTLLYSEDVELVLNLKSLFSDTGYEIEKLQFNSSKVFAHVLPDGRANWSIMKEDTTLVEDTSSMSFNMKLRDVVIDKADIIYVDDESNMKAILKNFAHHTQGDLTADSSLLITKSTVDTLSFWMDDVEYITKANAMLNANINANLNKMIFTFDKNESYINAIPFSFEGWVKMLDDGYDMDLVLNTKKVDFKAVLSMVPMIYAESFEDMKAGGEVVMSGYIKGLMVGDYYPSFDFKLNAKNGWFQYPNLPKSLQNINVAGHISNPGLTLDATIIDISTFSFTMGGIPFSAQMRIANPMTDPDLKLNAKGKIDLGMIKDLYPLPKDTKLNGVLELNFNLAGRMSYYDNNLYDKFQFGGNLNIRNMLLKMNSLPQDVSISTANMIFNNRYVDLTTMKLKIGRNDITANGKLENFVAYALHNKTIAGKLNLQSNYFNMSDFMSSDEPQNVPADTSKLSVIVIPKNVEFTMLANFKELVYDKMNFTNAKGILNISNGEMKIQNMGLNAFGGNLLVNGLYSTSNERKPLFNFDMTLNEVVFTEIFKQVETIQKFAPIFEKSVGKFSTKLSVNSLLKSDMMPDLATLIGNGSFATKSVGISNVPALTALAAGLKRKDLSNATLKDVGILFDIKDGKLITKPFPIKIADIKMNLGGATGLDKSIAYLGDVQLPDKYNLGKFSTVKVKIGGTFSKPKVEVDLKNTITNVVNDTKTKITSEVNKQADVAKQKALEEARKQKENAINVANEKADMLRAEAQKIGDKLITEAQTKGDQLIEKTTNPVTKKLAQVAAKKLIDEAKIKAAEINNKADQEAQKLIQNAANEVKL